jgi:hypothetical protein
MEVRDSDMIRAASPIPTNSESLSSFIPAFKVFINSNVLNQFDCNDRKHFNSHLDCYQLD